jgi:hypothetical protein
MIAMKTNVVWLIATLLVFASAQLTLGATPVHAQDVGFPPWPVIYDGHVFMDGEPVSAGTLTARVGDWESLGVPVVNGLFRCADPCLIVGPPDFSYVGLPVSFHLAGEARPAHLQFDFPAMEQPLRDSIDLFFGDVPSARTSSFWIAWLVGGLVSVTVLAFGLYRWLLRLPSNRP